MASSGGCSLLGTWDDVCLATEVSMDTNESGTTNKPVPAPRAHRPVMWMVIAFCAGLVLLIALNMK